MKFKLGYDTLVNNLEYVSTIVEDRLLDESMRNIIVRINKSGIVHFIGYNSIVICRTRLEEGDYRLTEEDDKYDESQNFYMQLKAKELMNFLNTFKSLKRTKPTDVLIETVNNKLRLTVFEVEDTDNGIRELSSKWVFDNIPLKLNVKNEINMELKATETSLQSINVSFYLASLTPLLSDENGNGLPSRMHFGDEYVFVVTGMFATLFKNELPEAFKQVVFTYSALNFMKKVLDRNEVVDIGKTESHLILATDTSEAFIRYIPKMPDTAIYQKAFKRDHVIVLDRKYLKDVVKRLSLTNDMATVEIDTSNEGILVKNSKFSQLVPIQFERGMTELGKITFKIATKVLDKAIIGDDNVFPEQIGIYINPLANTGYVLIFSDSSDKWFSTVQVR